LIFVSREKIINKKERISLLISWKKKKKIRKFRKKREKKGKKRKMLKTLRKK